MWKDPDTFRPERFSETNTNPAFEGRWAGYRPEAQGSSLYPNEVAADFAFIPFGGGARKCVGDQFALLEATVALAMLLRYCCWNVVEHSCVQVMFERLVCSYSAVIVPVVTSAAGNFSSSSSSSSSSSY